MSPPAHFIAGHPAGFPGEAALEVRSPWAGSALGSIPLGGAAAVEAAVAAAAGAFSAWRRRPLEARIGHVEALRARVEEESEALARLLVQEVGKPIRAARLEVKNLLAALRYFCDEAPRQVRDFALPGHGDFTPRVARDPVGVVAAITPFNFPVQLLSWKLCPAVLAGCPVVCKPDPRTPLSTVRLAEWAAQVGWPPGVFNVLHGDASTGALLVADRRVAKVAFTGSVEGGRAVYRSAAGGLKRVTLELGGCSPLVVCADADFDACMDQILNRAFYNSGQYCFRINRAIVDRRRYGEFQAALRRAAERLVVGDPDAEGTDLGPLIDRRAAELVRERIDEAERLGARVLLDGRRAAPGAACALGPTLLADVPEAAAVLHRETFGPVVSIVSFDDLEEAIARANETEYGLAAFALTRDPATGWRLSQELEAGTVWINALDKTLLELPFGGVKQSGIGVEKSPWAFDEYLQRRAIYFGFPAGGGSEPTQV